MLAMTLEQALLAAVTTLAGCIGALAMWIKTQFTAIISKLNDCESDREALWREMLDLSESKKDKTEHFTTPPIRRRAALSNEERRNAERRKKNPPEQ